MNNRRGGKALWGVVALCALAAAILIPWLMSQQNHEPAALRIACGRDAAGLLVSYAAESTDGVVKQQENVDYLQLADCCGTQAEFALGSGVFDMAVLCPDAAELFLASASGQGYSIAGGIAFNTNVLVQKTDAAVTSVGYMNGRSLQIRAVRANVPGEIDFQPMMATALPYALERDAVDGVVLDVLSVAEAGVDGLCVPLDFQEPASVLVVNDQVRGTESYGRFLTGYNQAVELFNSDDFDNLFSTLIHGKDNEESLKLWRKTGVRFIPIPNED